MNAAPPRAPRLRLPRVSESAGALGLLVVPMLSGAALLFMPRAVTPELLPPLVLPEVEAARAIAADAADARKAPPTSTADALREQVLAQGVAEVKGEEDADLYRARRDRMQQLADAVVAESGAPALRALRAELVESAESALALRVPMARAREILGALPSMLARDGATVDGTLLVPPFVVRTLSKARVNVLFGRRAEHDLARVELLALYGFQALHGERQPLIRRIEALERYARLGGGRAEEALGVMLVQNGELQVAAQVLPALAARRFDVRLRNYARDVREQAAAARKAH